MFVSCGTFNVLLFNKKKKRRKKNSNKNLKTENVSSVSELDVRFGTLYSNYTIFLQTVVVDQTEIPSLSQFLADVSM